MNTKEIMDRIIATKYLQQQGIELNNYRKQNEVKAMLQYVYEVRNHIVTVWNTDIIFLLDFAYYVENEIEYIRTFITHHPSIVGFHETTLYIVNIENLKIIENILYYIISNKIKGDDHY